MVAHSNQRTSFPILVGQNKNSPTIRSLPTSGFGFIFQRILISHGCIDCGESLFQELIGVFWRKVSLSYQLDLYREPILAFLPADERNQPGYDKPLDRTLEVVVRAQMCSIDHFSNGRCIPAVLALEPENVCVKACHSSLGHVVSSVCYAIVFQDLTNPLEGNVLLLPDLSNGLALNTKLVYDPLVAFFFHCHGLISCKSVYNP